MKIPRTLKENEIHIKAIPQSLKKVELMLYTDRITIMNIMDETYGVGKWQSSHKTRTKGDGSTEMFCEVKVFNEEIGQWLSRDDAGLGMNDKTQSTDAFKRPCVLWGVGTELYSLPEEKIIIDAYRPAVDSYGKPIELNGIQQNETIVNVEQDENGNYFCPDVFKITQYHLDDKYMIDGLAIKNLSSGKMVYTFIPEGFEKPRKRAVDITRYECIIPDIGKYARSKTPLKNLSCEELLWLFDHTKQAQVKNGIVVLVHNNPVAKELFISSGINVDEAYKNINI